MRGQIHVHGKTATHTSFVSDLDAPHPRGISTAGNRSHANHQSQLTPRRLARRVSRRRVRRGPPADDQTIGQRFWLATSLIPDDLANVKLFGDWLVNKAART